MIARIKGQLVHISFTEIIVDVNGVGYRISIPMSTYDKLPLQNKEVVLLTFMNVREDAIHLYGFASQDEKDLFEQLISVSGIGPKVALNILSSTPVTSFCSSIISEDLTAIKKINGIGKKTAERLVIELRDKVKKLSPESASVEDNLGNSLPVAEDAIMALEQLGFKHDRAHKAVYNLVSKLAKKECSSENLIRKSLQALNK